MRTKLLDERAIAYIALHVPTEVGNAGSDSSAWAEDPEALGQGVEYLPVGQMLEEMLEEHRARGGVWKGNAASEVPVEVGVHAQDVYVHPPGQPVWSARKVQLKVTGLAKDPARLAPRNGREQRCSVQLCPLTHSVRSNATKRAHAGPALQPLTAVSSPLLEVVPYRPHSSSSQPTRLGALDSCRGRVWTAARTASSRPRRCVRDRNAATGNRSTSCSA